MTGLESLVMVLLCAESVFALGLFLQAVSSTCLQTPNVTRRIIRRIESLRSDKQNRCGAAGNKGSRATAKATETANDPIENLLTNLVGSVGIGHSEHSAVLSGLIRQLLGLTDNGARSLAIFLCKTAPLLGLAGTLIGISSALAAFSADAGSPEPIIAGFATAMGTTLWGILIAFAAIFSSRVLWQPAIAQTEAAISQLLLIAGKSAPKDRRSGKFTEMNCGNARGNHCKSSANGPSVAKRRTRYDPIL